MNPVSRIGAALSQVATLGFIGYLPVAPGTWGTLVGLVIVTVFSPGSTALAFAIALTFAVGVAAAGAAELVIGEKDSSHIVIDELAGYLVSVLLLPQSVAYYVAAFFLFRLFDILKPFPIRYLERTLRGGTGVMADDVMAGVYANAVLQAWIRLF